MAFTWIDEPTEVLSLPSGNKITAKSVDLLGLIFSAENDSVPNGLLEQLSAQLSGQAVDRELLCVKGYRIPQPGEPVEQGQVRGTVVSATGVNEQFTVRVSMITTGEFKTGELRFGGMNVAMLEENREWGWRIGNGDVEQARKELPQMGAFIEMICRAAAVMPKLVKEVTDPETEMAISRMGAKDRMALFQWAMPREVRPASMFPQEQAAGLASTSDVQAVPPVASDGAGAETPVGEVAV